MSQTALRSTPVGPKATGRRVVGSGDLMSIGGQITDLANIQETSNALELSQSLSTYEQSEFIPDEILQVLTSAAKAAEKPELVKKSKTLKDAKVCIRATDQVWHHPLRRNKFKHLTDQPVCLTGAGRDISFLCDVLLKEKKNTSVASLKPISRSDMSPGTMEGSIEESLVPKEFYIVKNKGVLGLEYYEDKYTTLLEDDEKKLRLFPSMKPSGRAEVLQLMKVMDNMLKKAGVDEEDLKLEGPTQIHNLLELIKTEQNIYNVVFHELIRQVSTECVERGELLAKLRERYVMLLNKIPHQVLSLYNDLLAQRALDKCLTEEIIYFKNSIGELTDELYQVREHDLRMSKEAKHTQSELAKALKNAKKNANLLEEYRELYELQRSRLEKQLVHLTEERDLWSSATYRLARKVIEENQLQLARRLYISEKAWTKVVRHFIVLLASNDTRDLSEIQQTTEGWREHLARFDLEVQRSEESSREKMQIICTDLKKWLMYFQENVVSVDWHYQAVPEEAAVSLLQDLQNWKNMLSEEQQQFEGSRVVNSQESLQAAADIQKQWSQLGEIVFKRHESVDGSPAPEHQFMEDLNNTTKQLCEQYRRRVQGDNGVARGLTSFSNSLESWSLPLHAHKYVPKDITESDWTNLYHLLPEWIAQAERILELIGSPESAEYPSLDSIKKVELEEVFKMLQHWVLTSTSGTEREDEQLTQEITNLHTAMVQYMVDILILLSPDYSSDPADNKVVAGFGKEVLATTTVPVQKMQEEALSLSEKVDRFSSYIVRCCQDLLENSPLDEDAGYESRQLQTIKSSCNEWIETCKLLLSKVTNYAVPSEIRPQDPNLSGNKASGAQHGQVEVPGDMLRAGDDNDSIPKTTDHIEAVPFPSKIHTQARKDKLQNKMASAQGVMRIIGYDGNINKKSLKEEEIPVSIEGVLKASRPNTPRSIQAFESLTSLQQLEKRLLHTEKRAQKAEERAESLDEQLKAALQKIQELEIKSQSEESRMKVEETPMHIEVTSEEISLPVPAKKRPKSSKPKQHK
ncbi:axonemal dynein light chain domain-containing protein 1 [Mixophyes fleayi]|uniref:axonemal dynein light chain domain-containing protein 1 n=1 Tax=Mixophyes fleayi TaxID=3061075 RepID=UPI003F4E3F39